VLIYSLAALGLNILTGYAGQLSLGTGAFMGVGAYACYKLMTIFPDAQHRRRDRAVGLLLGGGGRRLRPAVAAHQGLLPRHRHAGRAVLLVWLFEKWAWLYNYNASGAIQVPNIEMFGVTVAGPGASPVTYYFVLCVVTVITGFSPSTSRAAASGACGRRCATWTSRPNWSASI
jgi:branched-chain amino acid transport system permease protein